MKKQELLIILGAGIVLATIVYVGMSYLFPKDNYDLWMGLFTEAVSTLFGLWFLDRRAHIREEKARELELEKQRLIRHMGGLVNEFALDATESMTRLGFDQDGSLEMVSFVNANLEGANLSFFILNGCDFTAANLRNSHMIRTSLVGANLSYANLQGVHIEGTLAKAILKNANMEGATLFLTNFLGANFQGANLRKISAFSVNLENANLSETDLRGAKLNRSNLRNAKFDGALMSVETIMPDEEPWSPEINLGMFTNPDDPDFLDFYSAWFKEMQN